MAARPGSLPGCCLAAKGFSIGCTAVRDVGVVTGVGSDATVLPAGVIVLGAGVAPTAGPVAAVPGGVIGLIAGVAPTAGPVAAVPGGVIGLIAEVAPTAGPGGLAGTMTTGVMGRVGVPPTVPPEAGG
jgi:hypothetical protein